MWTFPVIVDSRPAFLPSTGGGSLLLTPLGGGTVLSHLRTRLSVICNTPPLVAAGFEIDDAYQRAIDEACPDAEGLEALSRLTERFRRHDPSDRLLLADPACLPLDDSDAALRAFAREEDPRCVRHLVALRVGGRATREYVDTDSAGRVRGVQRFYDALTWPYAQGVACTLVPVACLRTAADLSCTLSQLRQLLASQSVPSRDVPLERGAANLASERGLLAMNEHLVMAMASRSEGRPGPRLVLRAGVTADIHPAAVVVGPVVAQEGAVVEDGALVIGPTVLGAHCRVRAGATVAQSVIGPRMTVPPATVLLHRVFFGDRGGDLFPTTKEAAPPPRFMPEEWETIAFSSPDESLRSFHPLLKRGIDVAVSAGALLLLCPLGLVIAALVKLESRGPVFFGHVRETSGGRPFRCWKFRTMRPGADVQQQRLRGRNEVDGPQFKVDEDPRRTAVGRVLAATNLDELPQLWNVLVGEMSLVGPRPSPFRENQLCVPWREGRLSVRPGLTGLWQICRHDRHKGDFHQWIYYDLLYVRNLSLGLDLRIMALTLLSLARRGGNIPLSWLLPPSRYGERRRRKSSVHVGRAQRAGDT